MDPAAVHACADRLIAAMAVIAAEAPSGPLYLSPLLRAAWRAAEAERAMARDPESRLVAQATLEAIERAQAPWRFALDEPLTTRVQAAAALHALVAGQGDLPALPVELDLAPILARYNGPLGGAWRLEGDPAGEGGHRIVRHGAVGEDELVCLAPRLANAIFLAGAHDDVAALLAEVIRLRTRLDEALREQDGRV